MLNKKVEHLEQIIQDISKRRTHDFEAIVSHFNQFVGKEFGNYLYLF